MKYITDGAVGVASFATVTALAFAGTGAAVAHADDAPAPSEPSVITQYMDDGQVEVSVSSIPNAWDLGMGGMIPTPGSYGIKNATVPTVFGTEPLKQTFTLTVTNNSNEQFILSDFDAQLEDAPEFAGVSSTRFVDGDFATTPVDDLILQPGETTGRNVEVTFPSVSIIREADGEVTGMGTVFNLSWDDYATGEEQGIQVTVGGGSVSTADYMSPAPAETTEAFLPDCGTGNTTGRICGVFGQMTPSMAPLAVAGQQSPSTTQTPAPEEDAKDGEIEGLVIPTPDTPKLGIPVVLTPVTPEAEPVAPVPTDEEGSYSFKNVAPGTYTVGLGDDTVELEKTPAPVVVEAGEQATAEPLIFKGAEEAPAPTPAPVAVEADEADDEASLVDVTLLWITLALIAVLAVIIGAVTLLATRVFLYAHVTATMRELREYEGDVARLSVKQKQRLQKAGVLPEGSI